MSEDKSRASEASDSGEDDVLRRAARAVRASPSLQAFAPLSASERERLVDDAMARAAPKPAAGRRRRVRVLAAGGGLAALAALVVVYGAGRSAPLARYAIAVAGEQGMRGSAVDAGARVALRPDTRVVITLTAEQPERDVLVRVALVREAGVTLLAPTVTRHHTGFIEIAGVGRELFGGQADGPGELVVVLGRALPDDAEIRALVRSTESPRDLQVMRRAVVLEGFSHGSIDVLLGGCSAVRAPVGLGGPGCEVLPGARLRLWVGVPAAASVELSFDGQRAAAPARASRGGLGFELDGRAGELGVRVDGRRVAGWRIEPGPAHAELRVSDAARLAGKLDEAAAALPSAPGTPELELAVVRRRAKLARLRGESDEERALRDRAVALARRLGLVSAEIDETVAILHGLREHHAIAAAAQLLPALDAHGALYAEGVVRRALVRGLLDSDLGNLGAALAELQGGLATAERIGDGGGRAAILGPLADVLQSLGRDHEAVALIDGELARSTEDSDVCGRVDAMTNAGWLLRDVEPARARGLADRAVGLAAERCKHRLAMALVNQGWLLAAAGETDAVRAVLARIAALPHEGDRVAIWAQRLETEIMLVEDPRNARRHARRLAARAASLCSSELAYEAQLLRARATMLLDRPVDAAEAVADAERGLAAWGQLVPLGDGRDSFFDRHDRLALAALPFFADQARRGVPGTRLALARTAWRSVAGFAASLAAGGRARARAGDAEDVSGVGMCQAREAAVRAVDAANGAPGHDSLIVHPTQRGLLVVAWRGSPRPSIEPHRHPAALPAGGEPRPSIQFLELPRRAVEEPPDALADRIAAAAAPLLTGVARLHLYVHRSLVAIPLDRRLAARLAVPVAFAVDAWPRGSIAAPARACEAHRALLVTNPQQNLWAATRSAPAIRRALEQRGLVVDALEGAAATRAAVERRLIDPCTEVLAYDGHAAAAEAIDHDRGADALLLAGGDRLTAADVMRLPRAPAAVVLNGCTTAAPEGLGLAQAFVLSGSAQVIASLAPVAAEDAARFAVALFDQPASADLDLVAWFARASAKLDVSTFRVFER